jgi:hypothetical protein
MSDNNNFGFTKWVPGFDFLQNLAKGATGGLPQMPPLSSWVAPTINVEELEKRINELKTVQFWLEQNSRALSATIQALEVQKMTLSTLQGMNVSMGDLANAFQLKGMDTLASAAQAMAPSTSRPAPAAPAPSTFTSAPASAAASATSAQGDTPNKTSAPAGAEPGLIDPMQWWGALTHQFQQIASNAMKDAALQNNLDATRNLATGMAQEALKTATSMASQFVPPVVASPAKKTSAKAPAAHKDEAPSSPAAPTPPAASKAAAKKAPAKTSTAARKKAP